MALTGEQATRLQAALLSGYPLRGRLANMVGFRLNENLEEITDGGSLTDAAFRLIQWAEAAGRTDELLAGALAEQPRNPELRSFAAEMGVAPAARPVSALGAPQPGKPGVLIDLSHNQGEWDRDAIFGAATGQLARLLRPPPLEPPWEIRAVRDRRQITAEELKPWSGLILGLPYHERIEDTTRYEIGRWVRAGGRLLLLGFELGERHHETNLNELAEDFGLRLNSDMAAPAGWQFGKPYDEPIIFTALASSHAVLSGVGRLRLTNLCTLTAEPGADIVLSLGENGLCRLQRDGVKYDSKGWIRGGLQKWEVIAGADWVPVIAEAPTGLTGQGRVLAIGTWQLFGPGYSFPAGLDNQRFVANLLDWLGGI